MCSQRDNWNVQAGLEHSKVDIKWVNCCYKHSSTATLSSGNLMWACGRVAVCLLSQSDSTCHNRTARFVRPYTHDHNHAFCCHRLPLGSNYKPLLVAALNNGLQRPHPAHALSSLSSQRAAALTRQTAWVNWWAGAPEMNGYTRWFEPWCAQTCKHALVQNGSLESPIWICRRV